MKDYFVETDFSVLMLALMIVATHSCHLMWLLGTALAYSLQSAMEHFSKVLTFSPRLVSDYSGPIKLLGSAVAGHTDHTDHRYPPTTLLNFHVTLRPHKSCFSFNQFHDPFHTYANAWRRPGRTPATTGERMGTFQSQGVSLLQTPSDVSPNSVLFVVWKDFSPRKFLCFVESSMLL